MAVRRTAPVVPNGFVASAARLPVSTQSRPSQAQHWMEEGWRYYDTVGELRFVANWVGNVMSRALLKAAREEDGVLVVEEDGPAAEALESYFGGRDGQAAMLAQTGVNLTVTGEGYHVMYGNDEQWAVLASGRVTQQNGIVYADWGEGRQPISSSDLCIRVWTPHPRNPLEADSPVRANLSTLSEIRRLNQHISAQLDSRLSGAGILFMPSEIQFAAPDGVDPQSNQADVFMQVLGETMMTPIKDRSSAAAVVPLVVTAPGDALDKVQHLTFWTELDAAALEMRDNAIKHLALGLDTPPEVLMGVAETNHWNAWLVDEAAVKSHLEPRLQVITAAISTTYLRPALEGQVPDPSQWHVVADTSSIRLRPDLSSSAIDLYDRGELSGDALRRETGFDSADAPDEDELTAWLLKKVATGQIAPEQSAGALSVLGVDLPVPGGTSQPDDATRTDTQRATKPRGPDIGRAERRIERIRDGEAAALAAACDALVFRALERAGNKMCDAKAKANGLGQYPAHERYLHQFGNRNPAETCMEGAWATAEAVLEPVTDDPFSVIPVLDTYVRGLIETRVPHDKETLVKVLAAAQVV